MQAERPFCKSENTVRDPKQQTTRLSHEWSRPAFTNTIHGESTRIQRKKQQNQTNEKEKENRKPTSQSAETTLIKKQKKAKSETQQRTDARIPATRKERQNTVGRNANQDDREMREQSDKIRA